MDFGSIAPLPVCSQFLYWRNWVICLPLLNFVHCVPVVLNISSSCSWNKDCFLFFFFPFQSGAFRLFLLCLAPARPPVLLKSRSPFPAPCSASLCWLGRPALVGERRFPLLPACWVFTMRMNRNCVKCFSVPIEMLREFAFWAVYTVVSGHFWMLSQSCILGMNPTRSRWVHVLYIGFKLLIISDLLFICRISVLFSIFYITAETLFIPVLFYSLEHVVITALKFSSASSICAVWGLSRSGFPFLSSVGRTACVLTSHIFGVSSWRGLGCAPLKSMISSDRSEPTLGPCWVSGFAGLPPCVCAGLGQGAPQSS